MTSLRTANRCEYISILIYVPTKVHVLTWKMLLGAFCCIHIIFPFILKSGFFLNSQKQQHSIFFNINKTQNC